MRRLGPGAERGLGRFRRAQLRADRVSVGWETVCGRRLVGVLVLKASPLLAGVPSYVKGILATTTDRSSFALFAIWKISRKVWDLPLLLGPTRTTLSFGPKENSCPPENLIFEIDALGLSVMSMSLPYPNSAPKN